jgi:hypothetical protein
VGNRRQEFSSQPAGFETKSNKKRNDAWPAMLGVYFFTVKTMECRLREMSADGWFAELEQQLNLDQCALQRELLWYMPAHFVI